MRSDWSIRRDGNTAISILSAIPSASVIPALISGEHLVKLVRVGNVYLVLSLSQQKIPHHFCAPVPPSPQRSYSFSNLSSRTHPDHPSCISEPSDKVTPTKKSQDWQATNPQTLPLITPENTNMNKYTKNLLTLSSPLLYPKTTIMPTAAFIDIYPLLMGGMEKQASKQVSCVNG